MATKPRTPNSQAQSSLRPVYEDFQPDSEFKETLHRHFLLIHLPGFRRDQIRITFVNFTRTLNIYGERTIDSENNRWSRFNESYPIPPNCEVERLQAKFSDGILTITMPKKVISHPSPKKAQDKATFPPKQQEPKPERKAHEDFPLKPKTTRVEEQPKPEKAQERIPQKYAPPRMEEPKPEKAQERTPQKYTPTRVEEAKLEKAQEKTSQKYTATGLKEARDKKTSSPQKGVEEAFTQKLETPPEERGLKAPLLSEPTKESRFQKGEDEIEPRKPRGEKPGKGSLETEEKPTLKMAPRKGQEEIKEKTTLSSTVPKTYEEKTSGSRKPEKMFEEKEIRRRKEAPKIPEKEKEETRNKEDIMGIIGKGIKQVSDSASQVVTRISEGKWKEEEKAMVVNMGAAVLVIAAFGAYMSYRFASSGRD